MDRSDVLSFLKDPPPELLLMSVQFANEAEEAAASEEVEAKVEKAPRTATSRKQPVPSPTPSGGPQSPRNWHGNKRLKKEHVATFERVYRQTNRPSVIISVYSGNLVTFSASRSWGLMLPFCFCFHLL
jgi:hypothetical protein